MEVESVTTGSEETLENDSEGKLESPVAEEALEINGDFGADEEVGGGVIGPKPEVRAAVEEMETKEDEKMKVEDKGNLLESKDANELLIGIEEGDTRDEQMEVEDKGDLLESKDANELLIGIEEGDTREGVEGGQEENAAQGQDEGEMGADKGQDKEDGQDRGEVEGSSQSHGVAKNADKEEEFRVWDHPKGKEPIISTASRKGRITIIGLPLDRYNYDLGRLHHLVLQLFDDLSKFVKLNNMPMVRRPRPGETELHLQFSKADKRNLLSYILKKKGSALLFKGMELKIYGYNTPATVKPVEDLGPVKIQDLIKIAAPYQEYPYSVQLQKKLEKIQKEIYCHMQIKFKSHPEPVVHDCVPAPMVDYYLNTVTVYTVRNEETSNIEAGYKVYFRNQPKIVPLHNLICVPRKFTDLVEDVMEWCKTPKGLVVTSSLKVTNHSNFGEIVGLVLQMNVKEEIVMTFVVKVPPNNAMKNEDLSNNLDDLPKAKFNEIKEKAGNLLDSLGSEYDLKAIYLRGRTFTGTLLTTPKNSEVILLKGTSVEEPLESNMGLYVEPRLQWSVAFRSEAEMIDCIVKLGQIDKDTKVFTSACTLKFIPFLLAQKAKEVIAFAQLQPPDNACSFAAEIRGEAKARMLNDKIDVIDKYEPGVIDHKLKGSTFVIWSSYQPWDIISELLKLEFARIVCACSRDGGVMKMMKQLGLSSYIPDEVVPIDTLPHTTQFGAVMTFKKVKSEMQPEKPQTKTKSTTKEALEEGISTPKTEEVVEEPLKRSPLVKQESKAGETSVPKQKELLLSNLANPPPSKEETAKEGVKRRRKAYQARKKEERKREKEKELGTAPTPNTAQKPNTSSKHSSVPKPSITPKPNTTPKPNMTPKPSPGPKPNAAPSSQTNKRKGDMFNMHERSPKARRRESPPPHRDYFTYSPFRKQQGSNFTRNYERFERRPPWSDQNRVENRGQALGFVSNEAVVSQVQEALAILNAAKQMAFSMPNQLNQCTVPNNAPVPSYQWREPQSFQPSFVPSKPQSYKQDQQQTYIPHPEPSFQQSAPRGGPVEAVPSSSNWGNTFGPIRAGPQAANEHHNWICPHSKPQGLPSREAQSSTGSVSQNKKKKKKKKPLDFSNSGSNKPGGPPPGYLAPSSISSWTELPPPSVEKDWWRDDFDHKPRECRDSQMTGREKGLSRSLDFQDKTSSLNFRSANSSVDFRSGNYAMSESRDRDDRCIGKHFSSPGSSHDSRKTWEDQGPSPFSRRWEGSEGDMVGERQGAGTSMSSLTEKAWGAHNTTMNMEDRYKALGRSFPPKYMF